MIFQPHLIVLDLDGTLLTDRQTISPKTKEVLLRAQAEGHYVMIATGRPYRASDPYYRELGLTTPIVNFNGAYVHNPRNNRFKEQHTPIDLSIVRDVVDSVNRYDYENIIAEIKDDVYLHADNDKSLDIFTMGEPTIVKGDLNLSLPASPTTLLIQAEEQHVASIRSHLSSVHAEVIDQRRWGAPFHIIEIVRNGLHKAVGLSLVAQHLNIPRERIIAFGDEDNDLEMIDFAGVGIAMGNGIDQLKNIANEITASNNEDGIARVLQERLKL